VRSIDADAFIEDMQAAKKNIRIEFPSRNTVDQFVAEMFYDFTISCIDAYADRRKEGHSGDSGQAITPIGSPKDAV